MSEFSANLEDLLEYPCSYNFKAIGLGVPAFAPAVELAVAATVEVPQGALQVRPSSGGKYHSVSVEVRLSSYEELTTIYAAIKQIPELKFMV